MLFFLFLFTLSVIYFFCKTNDLQKAFFSFSKYLKVIFYFVITTLHYVLFYSCCHSSFSLIPPVFLLCNAFYRFVLLSYFFNFTIFFLVLSIQTIFLLTMFLSYFCSFLSLNTSMYYSFSLFSFLCILLAFLLSTISISFFFSTYFSISSFSANMFFHVVLITLFIVLSPILW